MRMDIVDLARIFADQKGRMGLLPASFYPDCATLLANVYADGSRRELELATRMIRTIVTKRVTAIAVIAATLDKQPRAETLLDPEWLLFEAIRDAARKWGEKWLLGHPKFEPVIFM
jgi:hypothetical protein